MVAEGRDVAMSTYVLMSAPDLRQQGSCVCVCVCVCVCLCVQQPYVDVTTHSRPLRGERLSGA